MIKDKFDRLIKRIIDYEHGLVRKIWYRIKEVIINGGFVGKLVRLWEDMEKRIK